jgi:hypothetical protein
VPTHGLKVKESTVNKSEQRKAEREAGFDLEELVSKYGVVMLFNLLLKRLLIQRENYLDQIADQQQTIKKLGKMLKHGDPNAQDQTDQK